jgi:uncharacterized protein with GYD domain
MIFIMFLKFKQKPTKGVIARLDKGREALAKAGAKIIGTYWTLGRYDTVTIFEAKDEKTFMKMALTADTFDIASSETMVAVTREEALKLIE